MAIESVCNFKCVVSLLFILCPIYFSSAQISWDFDVPLEYRLKCVNGTPQPLYSVPNASVYYSVVEISSCPDTTIYVDALNYYGLRMPKKLKLILDEESMKVEQFRGLQIETLDVLYDSWGFTHVFNSGVLADMIDLKQLKLNKAALPSLPVTRLEEIELWNGKSVGPFGNCGLLKKLTLIWWGIDDVDKHWLKSCENLQILVLKQLPAATVEKILASTYALKELYIYKCHLLQLSELLLPEPNNRELRKLHVHHNRIRYINLLKAFPKLEDVDLSYNEISDCEEIVHILEKHPKTLVNFTVAHNKVLDLCQTDALPNYHDIIVIEDGSFLPKMKRLSFADTASTKLCLDVLQVESLQYLDLSKNKFTALEFQRLPLKTAKHLKEINLQGTPISTIHLNKSDYEMLLDHEQLKLSGLSLTVDCDCAQQWLAKAVRDKLVEVDVFCGNDTIKETPIDYIECDKYRCESCLCRRYWGSNTVTAVCDGEQIRIPQIANLTKLYASANLIDSINSKDLSDDLLVLDLKSNHIARLDQESVIALFSVKQRRISFGGNPIVCDCENVPLLDGLKTHRDQVEDYDNITCVDDGRGLDLVDLEELCAEPLDPKIWIGLSVLLGFCAVLAVIMALYNKYERQIKVFLYARGCCPWWLQEEELDADRPYDAFVSFAHEDDEFVMDTLLPELERQGYRLCVHYRDWIPGEWIPTQISRSIEYSRRTIIVLSKSYLGSVWGLLEFRMAHVSTLKEGRPRIIVLLLEDLCEDQIDDELRGYLKSNTYAKWGETWFWDKLKYAMPHRVVINENVEMKNCRN